MRSPPSCAPTGATGPKVSPPSPLVLLAAAAFLIFGGGEKHTVTGNMSLTTGSDLTTGSSCEGSSGFSDVASGTQVIIEDDSGKTLATSAYGSGVFDGT